MRLFTKKKEITQPDITSYVGFEQLYTTCFDKLYAIGIYHTKDEQITRDIIQEFFTSIWEKRSELREKEKIEAYLTHMFKYRIIDYFRAEAVRKKHHEKASTTYSNSGNNTEEEVLRADLQESWDTYINELPNQCQKVYIMSRKTGMSNKEIASSLLISERAVAYHLSKASSILQKKLSLYKIL
ncbi:MAG: RNA polymerase sigma-70 factor [Bacteroidota bacterium]